MQRKKSINRRLLLLVWYLLSIKSCKHHKILQNNCLLSKLVIKNQLIWDYKLFKNTINAIWRILKYWKISKMLLKRIFMTWKKPIGSACWNKKCIYYSKTWLNWRFNTKKIPILIIKEVLKVFNKMHKFLIRQITNEFHLCEFKQLNPSKL